MRGKGGRESTVGVEKGDSAREHGGARARQVGWEGGKFIYNQDHEITH